MAAETRFRLFPTQINHFVRLFNNRHNTRYFKILSNNYVIFSNELEIGEFEPNEKYVIFSLRDVNPYNISRVIYYEIVSNFYYSSNIGQFFTTEIDERSSEPLYKINFYKINEFNNFQLSQHLSEENGNKCICFQLEQLQTKFTPFQTVLPVAKQSTNIRRTPPPYGIVVNRQGRFLSQPIPNPHRAYENTSSSIHTNSRVSNQSNFHEYTKYIPIANFTPTPENGVMRPSDSKYVLLTNNVEEAKSFHNFIRHKKDEENADEEVEIREWKRRRTQRGGNKKTQKRRHKLEKFKYKSRKLRKLRKSRKHRHNKK